MLKVDYIMVSNAVFALFPAIPLAIAALNFRYTSIAVLMRDLSSQIEEDGSIVRGKEIFSAELRVLKQRMVLVKGALFFCGVAFISNLIALYFVSLSQMQIAHICLSTAIGTLIISISCFCAETVLSTKALNLHMSRLDDNI